MAMRRSLCARRRLASGALALLLAVLVLLLAGPRATAAPADAISLDDLQQAIDDNGGTLSGYFKTVLEDDVIVTIPATVRSIVPNMTQDGALILFEASGPEITAIGGIAQGMSGSPLYVDVPGPDKLAGAVSYGDMMTLDNMGLATPIEYMAAIEDRYLDGVSPAPAAARAATLATPLPVGSGTVRRVVVAPSLAAAKRVEVAAGTVVFAPLTAVQIGGLHPKTAAYRAAKAKLEAMGFSVVAPTAGMSAGYDPDWSTTLTGGASMAAMFARGDYWSGAAGTVTYVDGTDLLGFGHPLAWLGETDMYLTNALVSGIWKSGYVPYKLMAPAALRGSVTQDRNSGVAGRIGPVPADTVVTSSATFSGVTETSSSTTVRSLTSTSDWCWLPVSAAEVPVYKAIDAFALAGSAETTTTVVVSDGIQDYTLTRRNLYDSRSDVTYAAMDDLFMMLTMLTDDPDGVAPATIKSVDFDGAFSKSRKSARIVSVAVPGGLRVGTNDVQVSLAIYGQADLETVHVSLVIPDGVSPRGSLYVSGSGEDYFFEDDALLAPASNAGDDRRTLAGVVDALNELPANNDLTLEYWSEQSYEEPDVTVVAGTDWVVQGERRVSTSRVTLRATPKTVNYGAATLLWGWVEGPSETTTVDVYARPLGATTQKLVATVPAIMQDGVAEFEYQVPRVTKNTTYTAQWAGDGDFLASKRSVSVSVRPWVWLSADPASLRLGKATVLTATVRPVLPVRTVTIQRRTASGAWVTVTKKTATASGKAVLAWRPPRTGRYVLRAVAGSGRSRNVTITVKR